MLKSFQENPYLINYVFNHSPHYKVFSTIIFFLGLHGQNISKTKLKKNYSLFNLVTLLLQSNISFQSIFYYQTYLRTQSPRNAVLYSASFLLMYVIFEENCYLNHTIQSHYLMRFSHNTVFSRIQNARCAGLFATLRFAIIEENTFRSDQKKGFGSEHFCHPFRSNDLFFSFFASLGQAEHLHFDIFILLDPFEDVCDCTLESIQL